MPVKHVHIKLRNSVGRGKEMEADGLHVRSSWGGMVKEEQWQNGMLFHNICGGGGVFHYLIMGYHHEEPWGRIGAGVSSTRSPKADRFLTGDAKDPFGV